jgi:hypothetical protein
VIKIGIEVSRRNLHCDLVEHSARYFFILVANGRGNLCIRTCDIQGEDIKTHIIDTLVLKEDGNLHSILDDGINDAILELEDRKGPLADGEEFPISFYITGMISLMPDLAEWIISSILTKSRNLVINPIGSI